MNLLDATAQSVNTIFAQLIARIGVRNVQYMAHNLGITEQIGGPYFRQACAITLGSVGFTPLEMTDVYATLAAGGVHHDPQAFESVRGPNGKRDPAEVDGPAVLTANVAAQVTCALQGVVTRGTGTAAALGSARWPARPGPRRTSRTPGSAATCPSSPPASGSAIRRARSRCSTSRAGRGLRRHAARRDLAQLHGGSRREPAGQELPDAGLQRRHVHHRRPAPTARYVLADRVTFLRGAGMSAPWLHIPSTASTISSARRSSGPSAPTTPGGCGGAAARRRSIRRPTAAGPGRRRSRRAPAAASSCSSTAPRRCRGSRTRSARRARTSTSPAGTSTPSFRLEAGRADAARAAGRDGGASRRARPRLGGRAAAALPSGPRRGAAGARRARRRDAHLDGARRARAADALPPREARASSTTRRRSSAGST